MNLNTEKEKKKNHIEEITINDESEHDWLSDVLDKPTFRGPQKSMRTTSPDIQIIEKKANQRKEVNEINLIETQTQKDKENEKETQHYKDLSDLTGIILYNL